MKNKRATGPLVETSKTQLSFISKVQNKKMKDSSEIFISELFKLCRSELVAKFPLA